MFHREPNVGLYIDEKRVYAAEVTRSFGRARVVRSAESELAPAPEDSPGDPARVVQGIKQVLFKSGIETADVSLALPESEAIVRYFEMPILPKKEWRDAVRYEAQKYLPFETRELRYDYDVAIDKPRSRMKIIFLAAKKKTIEAYEELFREAGVTLTAAESVSFALLRAVHSESAETPEAAGAFVEIGPKGHFNLIVGKGPSILMTRQSLIPLGADGAVSLNALVSELRLSINYFAKNFKNDVLGDITLFEDSGLDLHSWAEPIRQEFSIPVFVKNPGQPIAKSSACSPGLSVAIGAGLRGASPRSEKKLNLLAKQPEPTAAVTPLDEEKSLKRFLAAEAAIIAGLLLTANGALTYQIASAREELSQMKMSQPRPSELPADLPYDELMNRENDYAKKIAYISGLVNKRVYWTQKMSALARITPKQIRLDKLDCGKSGDGRGGAVMIRGTAMPEGTGNALSVVNRFVETLRADKEFMYGLDEVRISSIEKPNVEKIGELQFSITCRSAEKTQST